MSLDEARMNPRQPEVRAEEEEQSDRRGALQPVTQIMPQTTCQRRGPMTSAMVSAATAGLEWAVTDCSQTRAPEKAASWFQRCTAVQTPSGTNASSDPIRSMRKFRAIFRSSGATVRSG